MGRGAEVARCAFRQREHILGRKTFVLELQMWHSARGMPKLDEVAQVVSLGDISQLVRHVRARA